MSRKASEHTENLLEVYVDTPRTWISEHKAELARLLEFHGEEKVIEALDACLMAGKRNVFLSTLSFQVTQNDGIERIVLHCYFPGMIRNPGGSATLTIRLPPTLKARLHSEVKRQWLPHYLEPPVEWVRDLVETLLSNRGQRTEAMSKKPLKAAAALRVELTETMRRTIEALLSSGLYELVVNQKDIAPGKPVRYVLRRKRRER